MAGHIPDSANLSWLTPDSILDRVRLFFGGDIGLDPCWADGAHTHPRKLYHLPENDGLSDPWDQGTIFVNPSYGTSYLNMATRECLTPKQFRDLGKPRTGYRRDNLRSWISKCIEASKSGSQVIALIPAYPGTRVWQLDISRTASAVCELAGRIKFRQSGSDELAPAPMDCALVYWGERIEEFTRVFSDTGTFKYPTTPTLALLKEVEVLRGQIRGEQPSDRPSEVL